MFISRVAQISIFIIVSVLIVIAGIAFVSFSSDFQLFADETSSYTISEYVEACMDQQLEKGLLLMGSQGGWIYPPEEIQYAKRGDPDVLVEKSQGLEDMGNTKIPYWYYYDDSSQTFKQNHIPPYDSDDEDSLRMQLKRYVDETLESHCIQDFSAFKDVYSIFYQSNQIDTNIEFVNDDIRATLDLPLEITEISTNKTDYVKDFSQEISNKIKVPYFLARDVSNAQDKTSFIDRRAMQILRPYMSKESRDLLPPTYDFSLELDSQPWYVPDVVKRMKQILSSNIHSIQLLEANANPSSLPQELQDSELAQGISSMHSKYYLGNTEEGIDHSLIRSQQEEIFDDYSYIDVNPQFQSFYPLSVTFTPSLGNIIIMPDTEYFVSLVPLATTNYQSAYEFHGPVVFSYKDTRQGDNDPFELKVAYEMNVKQNAPLKENYPSPNFEMPQQESISQTLICDRTQFVSELVKINITDPIAQREWPEDPKKGVDGALIEFTCKQGIAQCSLGTTTLDENNRTDLSFRLPINCDPGSLTISKINHKTIEIDEVNPSTNNEISLGEVSMPSAKTMDLEIGLRDYEDVGNSIIGPGFSTNDQGIIIFKHKEEEDFVRVVKFNAQTLSDQSIDLLPGEYSIEGFLIYEDEDHVIQEDEVCYRKLVEEECETLPQIELPTWIKGAYELGSFRVSTDDLIRNDILELDMINVGVPGTYDELEAISAKLENIAPKSESFKPNFKRER